MNKVSTCTKQNNPHESKYSYHKLKTTHKEKNNQLLHFTIFFFLFKKAEGICSLSPIVTDQNEIKASK